MHKKLHVTALRHGRSKATGARRRDDPPCGVEFEKMIEETLAAFRRQRERPEPILVKQLIMQALSSINSSLELARRSIQSEWLASRSLFWLCGRARASYPKFFVGLFEHVN
jgi:hypothetical protein